MYLLGILLAAASAFYLSFFIPSADGGWTGGVPLFTLAAFWLASGAMAYTAIRNGRIQSHKEWVIRSYMLTFSFVNFRWWIDFHFIATVGGATCNCRLARLDASTVCDRTGSPMEKRAQKRAKHLKCSMNFLQYSFRGMV